MLLKIFEELSNLVMQIIKAIGSESLLNLVNAFFALLSAYLFASWIRTIVNSLSFLILSIGNRYTISCLLQI